MRFMAILNPRLLGPSKAPAGNFERLLASLWRDASALASPPASSNDACCAAGQDPLLLAEWLRAAAAAKAPPMAARTR